MEQVVLQASRREETGKGVARKLRSAGHVPGVVYGLGRDAVAVTVSREELDEVLSHSGGANVVLDLRVEGAEQQAGMGALVKSMQRHPLSRDPESVDFQWISLTETVTVAVPIVLEGASEAQVEGAVIDQILYEAQVSCLPLVIPDQIVISIEGMELHETRTVAQLIVPEDAEVLDDPDAPVVTCTPPAKMEEPEDDLLEGELEDLEEGEEPVEGEEDAEESEEE